MTSDSWGRVRIIEARGECSHRRLKVRLNWDRKQVDEQMRQPGWLLKVVGKTCISKNPLQGL